MAKIGRFLFCIGILFFISYNSAFAASTVSVEIDPREAVVGEPVQVLLILTSTDRTGFGEPRPPDFEGFQLRGRSIAIGIEQRPVPSPQGMVIQNVQKKTYKYTLVPLRSGQLSIGSFDVALEGKTHRTEPVLIKVFEQGQGQTGRPQPRSRPRVQPQVDPFQQDDSEDPMDQIQKMEQEMMENLLQGRRRMLQDQPAPKVRTLPINPNEAFFIQVEVDKTSVYEWEPVIVTWYIYTRGQMQSLDRVKYPDMKGFFKEIIDENPNIQFSEEIVNGIPYRKAMLGTYALFPMKAGRAIIDEYKIKSKVSLLGYSGWGPAYEYTKSSKPVEITVKPLPSEGRPKEFTGAVGQFEIQAGVDNNSHPAHQPLSLRLRIEGSGNAKAVELPAIEWPKGLEIYDTRNESKFFKNGKSYKEFEILLIPRQEGTMQIPAINLSFFDPVQKKYYSRSTSPIPLQITPGQAPQPGATANANPTSSAKANTNAQLKNQLPSIQAQMGSNGISERIFGPLLLLLSLLATGLLAWKAKKELQLKLGSDDPSIELKKRIKRAKRKVSEEDYRAYAAEMLNLYYLSLGLTSEDPSHANLEKLLEAVSVSLRKEFGAEIRTSVDYYQALGFAPAELITSFKEMNRKNSEYDRAVKLLLEIIKARKD